MYCKANS